MYRAVDSFTAKGETPIAYSLEKSVDDLGPSGKRVLILISDGEETCAGDPCPTARRSWPRPALTCSSTRSASR